MSPTAPAGTNLASAGRSIFANRGLIYELAKRDVVGRYRGSVVGLAWSFFNPVLMLTVYTFVFGVVFGARWGNAAVASTVDFALILFVGMIVHSLFAECANRASALIIGNVNFVKKVVFPLEVLPVVTLLSALFHFAISLVVLLLALIIAGKPMHLSAVLLPLVLAPLVIATLGITWILASLGTFLRDVGQTISILTTMLLFLSPVFYPLSAVPQKYRQFILLNPLSFTIEQARDVLVWGQLPDWLWWGVHMAVALSIAAGGYWWFQRTRKGFADVV